jgi:hypothetical protein
MFSKSALAFITATVLAASYTSVQARTHPGGAVTQTAPQPRDAFAQGRRLPGDPSTLVNTPPRHCGSSTMEEGARSAFPAWDVCNTDR